MATMITNKDFPLTHTIGTPRSFSAKRKSLTKGTRLFAGIEISADFDISVVEDSMLIFGVVLSQS